MKMKCSIYQKKKKFFKPRFVDLFVTNFNYNAFDFVMTKITSTKIEITFLQYLQQQTKKKIIKKHAIILRILIHAKLQF